MENNTHTLTIGEAKNIEAHISYYKSDDHKSRVLYLNVDVKINLKNTAFDVATCAVHS